MTTLIETIRRGILPQMMKTWLVYSLFTFFCWGISVFLPKLAFNHISAKSTFIFQGCGYFIIIGIVLVYSKFNIDANPKGAGIAMLAGAIGMIGLLSFLQAMSKGKTSIVVLLTALYPLLTITLSFVILKENISLRQGIGILLALIAVVLLSI